MEYVEKLEAEHVLAAMRELGWNVGEKPPIHVLIRQKCKEKFDNGGDGGRCRELRDGAIELALRESGKLIVNNVADSVTHQLPEELQNVLDVLAEDFGKRMQVFDGEVAAYLDRYRKDVNTTADKSADESRKIAKELAASDEAEIKAAMLAIQSNEATIDELKSALTLALADTARAEGRALVLSDQVKSLNAKIKEVELKLDTLNDKYLKQMKSDTTKPSGVGKGQIKQSQKKQVNRSQKKSTSPRKNKVNEGGNESVLQVAPSVGGGE